MKKNPNQHLQYLGFSRAIPSICLQPFVMNYWIINRQTELDRFHYEYLHPDGGLGLIFNFGDPLYFNDIKITDNYFMDGIHTTSSLLGLKGNVHAIGIRFFPGGAYPFFSTPLHDINNQNINLEEMESKNTELLHEKLYRAKSISDVARILDNWLILNYRNLFQTSYHVSASVNRIQSHEGNINIKILASHLNIGLRQLERLFKTQLGMTPKKFTRIIKIDHARKKLNKLKDPNAEQKYYLDSFYDQAHFIKEFQSVVGETPTAYLNRKINNSV